MTDHLGVEIRGARLDVVLRRPERKNALTRDMYTAFTAALRRASEDPALRVVVVRADGDAFCGGNDLSDFLAADALGDDAPVLQLLRALARFDKPLVAQVQGAAVGIGATLLLHCDLAVASERAFFLTPFAQLGLVPEAASSLLLPALVGPRVAFELLVLGERIDAAGALRLGLVNRVTAPDELAAMTDQLVDRLLSLPDGAVRASRALLRRGGDVAEAIEREAAVFRDRLQQPETHAAIERAMRRR